MLTCEELCKENISYKYKNIISLGHFCGPAMQLEKYGLRKASYPFDWIIFTDFSAVLEMVSNGFYNTSFFDISVYSQGLNNRNYYRNDIYNIRFLHDFNSYLPLEKQFARFKSKYNRRMDRFQNDICEPTLFLRYISNEKELRYIESHLSEIDGILREGKSIENNIFYICNCELDTQLNILKVSRRDKSISMNFCFLEDNPNILQGMYNCYNEKLSYNKKNYRQQFYYYIEAKCNKILPPYIHYKTYNDQD